MHQQTDISTNQITSIGKLEDAGKLVRGGAIDKYWLRNGLAIKVRRFFREVPTHDWLFDSNLALKHFNLRSIEFGNWMNQEDRATFLYSSMLSLHHLANILQIDDKEIGMKGKLSISLGARGRGMASGHYEPNPFAVINITKTKGFGVLAHEFAHAVDNIISFHTGGRKQRFVSGGKTIRKGYSERIAKTGNWFEQQFEEFFNILNYDEKGNKTKFQEELSSYDDYWKERAEIFARTVEVFVHQRLKENGIKDTFLVQGSYVSEVYPSTELTTKVSPILDQLFKRAFNLMRRSKPLNGIQTELGYKGFRKTIKQKASLEDTLQNMQRIAFRDAYQVKELAKELQGKTEQESAENIWNYLRKNTSYKLDQHGIEELRTPARSLVDGKAGLTDTSFGIDCDDYTILISAILINLNIKHEYRVTAYQEKGKFQHIYPVAITRTGQEYIIDVVPEIPRFNYEAKPIVDLKKIPMELHELSGIEAQKTEKELQQDLIKELNEPFQLSGIDDEQDDDLLESHFLSGFGEVETEEQAEVILHGTDDAIALIENGLLAELQKAKLVLQKELKQPTILSKTINVKKELAIMRTIMNLWSDDQGRMNAMESAINAKSAYANFYQAMQMSLERLEEDDLSGIEDEDFDKPIYLAKVDMDEFRLENLIEDENLNGIDELGLFRRRKGKRKRGGFFKRIFKGIGKGIKKVVKAVVKYNPASIAIRAAIRLVLSINLFKIGSRLIYGYLSESEATAQKLDLSEWRKLVDAKNKAEKFYTKIGGKADKFKKAIVKGKASKVTGLQLGVAATGSTAAASGFIVFVKKILSAINPAKLFKKIANKTKQNSDEQNRQHNVINPTTDFPMQTIPQDQPKGIFNKMKAFIQKHKKRILAVGLSGVLVLVAVLFWNKTKKKKRRSLAGIKAARTRARNRRRTKAIAPRRRPTRRRARPQLKGSTTILKVPTKSVSRTRITKRSNGNRLKMMHVKAKQLQKKHPKTKYSTLLKKASKLI